MKMYDTDKRMTNFQNLTDKIKKEKSDSIVSFNSKNT